VSHRKPKTGEIIQLKLPNDCYAYGRVLRDASVAFYREMSSDPGDPPIGERDYQFVVGVYEDVLRSDEVPIVGRDPSTTTEDEWPPAFSVRDPISGDMKIYHHGVMRTAAVDECSGLEPAAVWDLHHLIDRLMGI
jgi:hypothetical protein